MSTIDIRRNHALSLAAAKKQADVMAAHLAEEFSVESTWSGNELHFTRPGVKGVMKVATDHVHVTAKLGMLVALLKGQIEKRLHAFFDEAFGASSAKAAGGKKATSDAAAAAKTVATKNASASRARAATKPAAKVPAKKAAAKKAAASKPSPRR